MAIGEISRHKFPHLLPGEVRVWRNFLRKYERLWDTFEYDVHVGKGSLPQEDPKGVFQKNYAWLTKKRIDVVGWRGTTATIFEIRSRASLPLMGQLLGYKALWMRANPNSEPPTLYMVCEFCAPDDEAVLAENGIHVVIV
jgi:hypothetical protein